MVTLAVRSIKKASIANKKEQKNLRDHIKQYRSQLGVFEDQVSAKLERMCFTDYEDIDPAMKIVRHNLC